MPFLDKEIHERDHHEHAIVLKKFNSRYICDGCREPGINSGFCCTEECNFVIHEQCKKHIGGSFRISRFPEHSFVFVKWLHFVSGGTGGTSTRQLAMCDVCVKTINGYAYTSYRNGTSVNIHPPCATLPHTINDGQLTLVREIYDHCIWCGYKSLPGILNSWAYVSTTTDLQIHVGCVKDLLFESSNGESSFGVRGTSCLALPSSSRLHSTAFAPRMLPSGSYSTALVPSTRPTTIVRRRPDRIKKYAKAIGHVVGAVLGSAATVAFGWLFAT